MIIKFLNLPNFDVYVDAVTILPLDGENEAMDALGGGWYAVGVLVSRRNIISPSISVHI